MTEGISYLIQLQSLDIIIDDLLSKAEAASPLIQAKNQEIDSLKDGLKQAKETLSRYQVKKKELEIEADSKEKLVQKHQGELNSLKSNDAYKAMLGEIQAAKQAVVKIEDEILNLMESIDAEDKRYKEKDKQLKASETALRKEIQDLEAQKSGLEGQAKTKKEERDAYAATVPAELRNQYEMIRQKRGGLAIVPLVDGKACGGCRMNMPPNKANEVKKAKSMILCESCSRIIYLPPEQKSEETSAPASQSTVAS